MRWTHTHTIISNNDTRHRKGFLLLPKTINNETRWLEFAKWTEIYRCGNAPYVGYFSGWELLCWGHFFKNGYNEYN